MDEQSHYKQDKTITRQSINVKRHIFNVIGDTEKFEERDLNIGGDFILLLKVENESGISNFIPILVADEEVCLEIKIMQMKYYSRLYAKDSESTTSATKSCEAAVNKFSELLVDIVWLLKQPFVEDMECALMSSQL
ncbi:hypothetical protein Tco_1014789 [Tanacetum coccineum]